MPKPAQKSVTPPPQVRVGRLDTLGSVASELGRLYRRAVRHEITSADASRLASVLAALRAALEASELEKRISELEHRHGDGGE